MTAQKQIPADENREKQLHLDRFAPLANAGVLPLRRAQGLNDKQRRQRLQEGWGEDQAAMVP
jgi:hypothetical protein